MTAAQNKVIGNDQEVFKKIVRLIENNIGVYKKPLTRETRLEQDLAITDEEAEELLNEFSLRFNVNLTGFDIKKYFPQDRNHMLIMLHYIFRRNTKYEHVLTIGDLVNAVKNGRLN